MCSSGPHDLLKLHFWDVLLSAPASVPVCPAPASALSCTCRHLCHCICLCPCLCPRPCPCPRPCLRLCRSPAPACAFASAVVAEGESRHKCGGAMNVRATLSQTMELPVGQIAAVRDRASAPGRRFRDAKESGWPDGYRARHVARHVAVDQPPATLPRSPPSPLVRVFLCACPQACVCVSNCGPTDSR